MEKAWLDEAVKLTQELWRAYLIYPSEEGRQLILASFDPHGLSLIGTGVHEFYSTAEQIIEGLTKDLAEAQATNFSIIDEYYAPSAVGEETCCVIGTLWVREKSDKAKHLLIEMDTRFTFVFRRSEGRWLLSHMHHSMPNVDQARDEFYPKTASEQANAAIEYSKVLERRAELDLMTELLNHVAFEKYVTSSIVEKGAGGAFFMIDLDNFKLVNDTLGHPEGDKVIIEFAELLSEIFAGNAYVGRMGGDEFAVYLTDPTDAKEIEAKARELVDCWSERSKGREVALGCSVGLARTEPGMTFATLYRNADEALYRSKRVGKGCFCW